MYSRSRYGNRDSTSKRDVAYAHKQNDVKLRVGYNCVSLFKRLSSLILVKNTVTY